MTPHSLLGSLALFTTAVIAQAAPPPLFGDWWYLMPEGWLDVEQQNGLSPCRGVPWFQYGSQDMYLPINQTGGAHGGPTYEEGTWKAWYANCLATQFHRLGAPIGIMIRNRNCPIPYASNGLPTDPDALWFALDALPKLDYIILDLEPWGDNGTELMRMNGEEVARIVRTNSNLSTSTAYIGNYGDWPGDVDETIIWPNLRDRTAYRTGSDESWDRDAFYRANFNLAMPIAYPYEVYSRHSDTSIQGENTTPNNRSAIFWAPLERVSTAARNLSQGDLLMPWVSNYVDHDGQTEFYNAPAPSWEDIAALLQHIRMRGAISYMLWTTDKQHTAHPTLGYLAFRSLALYAWRNMNPLFDSTEVVEYLNVETSKRTGLQWSGVRSGSRLWVLVSNLHHDLEQTAELPAIAGLPRFTPPVQPGEHLLLNYDITAEARDFDGNGTVNQEDFITFITTFQNAEPPTAFNSIGGRGAEPRDIDCNGLIDLADVLAISNAFLDGAFDPQPGGEDEGQGKGGSQSNSTGQGGSGPLSNRSGR